MASLSISEVYDRLVSLLAKHPQTIEILPGDGTIIQDHPSNPSFAPFFFIEGNLGMPQKVLRKIYLHALAIFNTARSVVPTRPSPEVHHWQDPDVDPAVVRMLAVSSSVMLLVESAHPTALNARKQLVRMRQIDPRDELRFLALLLTSQHAAKQSELWYHRRWLLSGAYDPHVAVGDSCSRVQFASQEAFQQELELLSRACQVYPRNYFAWAHRLICTRSLLSEYLIGVDTLGFVTILRNEFTSIKRWIDRHLSDHTAIHTILTISHVAFESKDSSLIKIIVEEDLLSHAISLVQEYPTHEALWMYVRTAHTIPATRQDQRVQQFADHFVQPLIRMQCAKISRMEDLIQASRHAKQFLDRMADSKITGGRRT